MELGEREIEGNNTDQERFVLRGLVCADGEDVRDRNSRA